MHEVVIHMEYQQRDMSQDILVDTNHPFRACKVIKYTYHIVQHQADVVLLMIKLTFILEDFSSECKI